MYIDAPFYVPVRSTGTPGTIRITASSGSLEAGTVIVESTAPTEAPINGLKIPAIKDPVDEVSDVEEFVDVAESPVPAGGMVYTGMDIDFTDTDPHEYGEKLDVHIASENPDVEIEPVVYNTLKELLIDYIEKNDGILVRDDYNFLAGRANMCLKACNEANSFEMPEKKKRELKEKYAADILLKGINPHIS